MKKSMRIPGTTKVQLSLLMILATSSVTSTSLLISAQANNISEESTSCRKENPKGESDVLLLRATGRNTMDLAQN